MLNKRIGITHLSCAMVSGVLILASGELQAEGGVFFNDIAVGDSSGISYRSEPTFSEPLWIELYTQPVYGFSDMPFTPAKSRGNPPAALFDYDNDGDLDIFVGNSGDDVPASGHFPVNSLYANQWQETGELTFVDVAVAAGVDVAMGIAAAGVCYGDTDNDGDQDLMILGHPTNTFFENKGDGTFTDVTANTEGLAGEGKYPGACAFGDVNGDGLLDLVIANSYDNWTHRMPLMLIEYAHLMQHNQLFINKGGNAFESMGAQSGIQDVNRISWAVGLVDYDLDGDVDLFIADDQGPKPTAATGGVDHGVVHVYENDGAGHFTNVTDAVGTNIVGAWMGLSFGDFNSDGRLDFFATNDGDYLKNALEPLVGVSDSWPSAWFLGRDGGFTFPGLGTMGTSRFGWGTGAFDYDNDGDTDIVYHGGLNMGPFVASNPGTLLSNDGRAHFNLVIDALETSDYHLRRNVQGTAIGDLNKDGFIDVVTVSNMNWPEFMPLVPYEPLGGVFDGVAFTWPTFSPLDATSPLLGFVWNGVDPLNGTLAVEMNSGDNGNRWARVEVMGTKGLTGRGVVNRDGIGAVLTFKPRHGRSVMMPVGAGGSHNSAHERAVTFGLGDAEKGTLEILWPGGVRNKLFNVGAAEVITVPEIPCSYDDSSVPFTDYKQCVEQALVELRDQGVLSDDAVARFRGSAVKAYRQGAGQ